MRKVIVITLSVFVCSVTLGQRIVVSDNNRFLQKENGEPFFYTADTAWELLHRCTKEETIYYLNTRKKQGFNVIQTVALAELDGLNTPNRDGNRPLINNDPAQPNEEYFKHVDFVIEEADKLGMYIALLPTWGDKLDRKSWGTGPEVFNIENAYQFGEWLGNRYKHRRNIIWIIGGDRNPRDGRDDVEVWRSMARGVVESNGGNENVLMSFHPQPQETGGSSTWFHNDQWLDFNMHQTGHCAYRGTYLNISHDYNLQPTKPVFDGEPLYEDHPNCFNAKELGHSIPEDIRRIMYWNVFAGACGQTYGCHDVWQMYTNDVEGINSPLRPWKEALNLPMARQVRHLKNLMLSRPYFTRIPDQSLIKVKQEDTNDYVIATRDSEGTYAMIYYPTGKPVSLNLESLASPLLEVTWYDPRTGNSFQGESIRKSNDISITPPTHGMGNDWVLVLDDPSSQFKSPGTPD